MVGGGVGSTTCKGGGVGSTTGKGGGVGSIIRKGGRASTATDICRCNPPPTLTLC